MPRYKFVIELPVAIPEDTLRTELNKFVKDLLKKYGEYTVEVRVKQEVGSETEEGTEVGSETEEEVTL